METKLINIGNSRGIIIPKRIIDRLGSRSFKISETEGSIILKPIEPTNEPRAGWQEAFAKVVRESGYDGDFFKDVRNDFDEDEWTW